MTNPFLANFRKHVADKHHSQSPPPRPNALYPLDRPVIMAQRPHKYRIPTPPKIYPASRHPDNWKHSQEGDGVATINRIGRKTEAKRSLKNLTENSKGI